MEARTHVVDVVFSEPLDFKLSPGSSYVIDKTNTRPTHPVVSPASRLVFEWRNAVCIMTAGALNLLLTYAWT